jgi:pyrimidine operon attenuation protein/uracil phosphoribosyltransferase
VGSSQAGRTREGAGGTARGGPASPTPLQVSTSLECSTSLLLSEVDVERALRRISHEIVEANHGCDSVVIVGIEHGGVPLAVRVGAVLSEITETTLPVLRLDVSGFRDDRAHALRRGLGEPSSELTDKTVVLFDDVLCTGRTVRAALDALSRRGRPAAVQLGVLVDRGHRELPIRADFVGKNLPTRSDEIVVASLAGVSLVRARRDEI